MKTLVHAARLCGPPAIMTKSYTLPPARLWPANRLLTRVTWQRMFERIELRTRIVLSWLSTEFCVADVDGILSIRRVNA